MATTNKHRVKYDDNINDNMIYLQISISVGKNDDYSFESTIKILNYKFPN